ncbi:MAG: Gfo/Idh/MocA family oxidoreductase [Actinomycetales bacterium]|nr:Gfo/Idh/MocA family oxidoreductase [Actinomycetales bacterium]
MEPVLNPLRVGIVGAGENARDHARACQAVPGATLTAICDVQPAAAARLGAEFACPAQYTDLAAMLDAQQLDVVIVSVWGRHHAEVACTAMQHGTVAAVLVEKPLSLTASEAADMVSVASATGVLLVEGFKWRYDPQHLAVAELLSAGRIGAVRTVIGVFSSPLMGHAPAGNWRFRASVGGGSLNDTASYLIHLARLAMRADPLTAFAISGPFAGPAGDQAELAASMVLDFGDGRTALLQSSYQQAYCQQVSVLGTTGWLRFNLPFDARSTRHAEFVDTPPLPGTVDIFGDDFSHELMTFPACDQFAAQLQHICDCLAGTSTPLATGAFAVGGMATLDALRSSASSGAAVPVQVPVGVHSWPGTQPPVADEGGNGQ